MIKVYGFSSQLVVLQIGLRDLPTFQTVKSTGSSDSMDSIQYRTDVQFESVLVDFFFKFKIENMTLKENLYNVFLLFINPKKIIFFFPTK